MNDKYIAFNLRNTVVLALALLITSAITFFSYLNLSDIKLLTTRRVDVQSNLTRVENIQTALNEAETGQRGFLLTGRESYLEPYHRSVPLIRRNLHFLLESEIIDSTIRKELLKFQTIFAQRADEMAESIHIRKNLGMSAAVSFVVTDKGKKLMDDSRQLIFSIKEMEENQLNEASIKRNHALNLGSQIILLGSSASLFLIVVAALLVNRELRQRKSRELAAKSSELSLENERRRLSQIISTQYDISIATRDKEFLMDLIVARAALLTSSDGAVIEEVDGDEIVYRSVYGMASTKKNFRMKLKESLAEKCLADNQILRIVDAKAEAQFNIAARYAVGLNSVAVIPLKYSGKLKCALTIFSQRSNAFNNDDVSTMQLMAGLLGSAMTYADEFKAKQEAEHRAVEASKIKSDFLANMSHEIRTPLNGVLGMADLLSESNLDADQRVFTQSIRQSAEALLVIVNDVLDFSKIEYGKLDIESVSFDIDNVLSDIGKTFSHQARKKGLRFSIKNPIHQSHFLLGDPGRLRQIILNLLSNALKFTHSGQIELRITSSVASPDKLNLKFEVEDSGIGIPVEKQDRLFQVFSQVDSSTSRRYGGTGLGLSICKKLVTLMDGEIGFSSEAGKYSIFWITLPFMVGSNLVEATEEIITSVVPAISRCRILIAEDNHINQKVVHRIIERLGHRGFGVNNGIEALETLKQARYDLILMDCQMPELDGYETAQKIRSLKDASYSLIPIIALTANAIKGDRERCLAAGMNDYLTKPIRIRDLAEMLTKWLPKTIAAAALPADSSLDMERVNALLDINNDDGVSILRDLIPIFVREAPLQVAAMSNALEKNDFKTLKFEAHRAKGVGSNMGLSLFADLCENLEDIDESLDSEAIRLLIEQLSKECSKASLELQSLMQSHEQMKRA